MKFKLSKEEYAHIYTFVGGLTHMPMINRHNRRLLAKLANKFGPNAGEVTLNQSMLTFLMAILHNAIESAKKAQAKPGVTLEQINQIEATNAVFIGIVDKLNKKILNPSAVEGLGMVLGTPQLSVMNEGEVNNG